MSTKEYAVAPAIDHRDNRFDFMRILAAWLVLFSHCYPLGGWPDKEPLATTVGIDTFGGIGVAIFFVLSGYLVTISLERSPGILTFVKRRALRIYPALIVASLLSILLLGLTLTQLSWREYLFNRATWHYLSAATAWVIPFSLPGVFAGTPIPNVINGSLWSLPYELRCYLALIVLSLLPLKLRIKTPIACALLAAVCIFRPAVPPATPDLAWFGLDYYHSKLGLYFAMGSMFASWRNELRPNLRVGVALMASIVLLPLVGINVTQLLFVLGLSMTVLWLALYGLWLPSIPQKIGDWSYGTYLYGFPVQQFLAQMGVHRSGLWTFLICSTLLTLACAGLSWHCIEKPAMRWK